LKIAIYTPLEEKINIISHALGGILSIVALCFLTLRAMQNGVLAIICSVVFGLSLILLYGASSAYHFSHQPEIRKKLNIIDHASIYVLISGTYTPYVLITLHGTIGWLIFIISWSMALSGIMLKLFFTGKYHKISTAMYILMGWVIIFAIKPLIHNLSLAGLLWLFAGGISYTVGAIIYSIDKMQFNHAVFHLFVLGGSVCHFMSIYFYVI